MNRVDDLLYDTLTADPRPATGDGWERAARRGNQLVRRRRMRRAGVVGLAIAVLVVVSAVMLRDRSNGRAHSVVANPASPGLAIVADTSGGGIVTIDPTDGRLLSHLVDSTPNGTNGILPGIAVSPDATTLFYTRSSSSVGCSSTVVMERTIATGAEHELVCGFSPVVSPDGQWIAYTTVEGGYDFLAMTSLSTKANYRPYEQLLGEQHSKVQPLTWSPDDRLVWNRFAAGVTDQQTYQLISPPLDHGDQPTPLTTSATVQAAAFLADGRLAVAQGNSDHWTLDVLNTDGTTATSRYQGSGAMPTTIAAASNGDALLFVMPDGRLLTQEGNNQPRVLATGVEAAVWTKTQQTGPATTTTTAPPTPTTAPAPTTASSGSQATSDQATITNVFEKWISGPGVDATVPLIEDGEALRSTLSQVPAGSASAQQHSARVDAIHLVDDSHASVTYSILDQSGAVVLGDRQGDAVKIDGTWRVSRATYCALVALGGIQCPPK